jgi:hypothetical protein
VNRAIEQVCLFLPFLCSSFSFIAPSQVVELSIELASRLGFDSLRSKGFVRSAGEKLS